MSKDIYRETFSHVRSSYELNMEDFEKMKTKKAFSLKKGLIAAAAAALVAAVGITAYATDFFGLSDMVMPEKDPVYGSYLTLQGYADAAESKAYEEYRSGALSLEEAAAKYGLKAQTRCVDMSYDELTALQGGDIFDARHERSGCYIYENGAFGLDGTYALENGAALDYQLVRSVKGSVVDNMLYLGDPAGYEQWNMDVGGRTLALALGAEKALVIADLGDSFVTVNVLAGTSGAAGTPALTKEDLEEFAKSFNWNVLEKVAEPDMSSAPPEVQYGAGVELLPEYIDEEQSFEVELAGWDKVWFISYRPTPEFGDMRFFLSKDKKVSDYEFHPVCNDNKSVSVAAVSFGDFTGMGVGDVLVLLDYVTKNGAAYRDVHLFRYAGEGEFVLEPGIGEAMRQASADPEPTVADVRRFCKTYYGAGVRLDTERVTDVVATSFTIQEGRKRLVIEAIGRKAPFDDSWGIREIRIYENSASGEPMQVINVREAEGFVNGIYAGYTEAPRREGTMTALDINLDGFCDLGVQDGMEADAPCCYWFWDNDAGKFVYGATLRNAEVRDGQIVECYKANEGVSDYVYNTYESDGQGGLKLVKTETAGHGDAVEANDYQGILAYLQAQDYESLYLRYGLFDLTGDGTPELIAGYGHYEADAEAGVWSMDTGRLEKLGSFDMAHSLLYVVNGKLTRLMGQMGYEVVSRIGYDGDQVTETEISHRVLGPEEDYQTFLNAFEMAEDGDLSLLESAGLK